MDSQNCATSTPPTIEELQHKIAQLENETIQLKNLIEILPGDIYWKNKDGAWAGANKRCRQSLQRMGFIKYALESEVLGKTDFQLFNQGTAEGNRQNDLQVMETKTEISSEETTQLPSGEKITLLSTKSPLWDKNGKVVGIVGNTIDISHLKDIEAELKEAKNNAEAASYAKTEFLANMRHDIRTPLSGIVGFSEILKAESHDPRIKEYANNLVASSHALLALMDEVLEAVRVSSGEIPILKRKFDLVELFEQIIALYTARALEKRINLSLNWDDNLPHFAIGDKIRVHRITLELIGNALNFTDKGFVSVQVNLAKQEKQQLVIKISVKDSGIGIAKEKQQEIYVQFKRLTPSYQGIYKGTGLGLYVVKQFIDELGGEIYIESELHKGTCFTCLIPLQKSLLDDDFGTESPEVKIQPSAAIAHSTTEVLVVEDNPIAQSVARALLSSLACRVDVAANSNEALEFYKKNHYDLILMDIGLGAGMDGYELAQHIRHQEGEIPIVALTAHASDDNRQRFIESGINVVLTKPLTQMHAKDILNSFVPARRTAASIQPTQTLRGLPEHDVEFFQLAPYVLLDHEQALKNCGNHATLVALLTLMITQELPADLKQMKKAFHKRDFPLIEKVAHKIKGGAVYVGTERMKFACQFLERYWKTGERELLEKLYYQAIATVEETCVYINKWLKN